METLRQLIAKPELTVAPLVLNPIMARLAEDAGFKAIYLGGGTLGWQQCVTEANITLPEMARVAVDIRVACKLPIVLDGGGGWGDPAHMHRTIRLCEAAGFAAIEIEDQFLPRRFHHHVGDERLIEPEHMVMKIKECVAARTNPDFLIIARTNATRTEGREGAVRKRRSVPQGGRGHAVRPHPHARGHPLRRRAVARAADGVRARGRLRWLSDQPRRDGQARLPAGGLVRQRVRGDVQGRRANPTPASPTTRSTRSSAKAARPSN